MCGKKCMDKISAMLLIAKNSKQNLKLGVKDNRREIRLYYCGECKAYHTTSQKKGANLLEKYINS